MQEPAPEQIDAFISAWSRSGGHERGAGQQLFQIKNQKSKINDQQSSIHPPYRPGLPSFLSKSPPSKNSSPLTGPDPSALAAHFGKRTKARIQQIEEILKTLEGLGKL